MYTNNVTQYDTMHSSQVPSQDTLNVFSSSTEAKAAFLNSVTSHSFFSPFKNQFSRIFGKTPSHSQNQSKT